MINKVLLLTQIKVTNSNLDKNFIMKSPKFPISLVFLKVILMKVVSNIPIKMVNILLKNMPQRTGQMERRKKEEKQIKKLFIRMINPLRQ